MQLAVALQGGMVRPARFVVYFRLAASDNPPLISKLVVGILAARDRFLEKINTAPASIHL